MMRIVQSVYCSPRTEWQHIPLRNYCCHPHQEAGEQTVLGQNRRAGREVGELGNDEGSEGSYFEITISIQE
jgi:hypothetical protein